MKAQLAELIPYKLDAVPTDEVTKRSVYQEVVDNALLATGARLVVLARYDPASQAVFTTAWGGFTSEPAKLALAAVKRFLPSFDPTHVVVKPDVNPFQSAVYLRGETVSAPFKDIAKGVVDDTILHLCSTIMGIENSFICPMKGAGDQVVGSLSFHTSEKPNVAMQQTFQAFTKQVALTLENSLLLDALRHQVAELQRSRQQITAAEERLRREIADMLHGRVQTRLLMAWHRLGQFDLLLDSNSSEARALLGQVRDEIDQIREQEVRQASHLLHPSIIRIGLLPAVRSLARHYQEHFAVSIYADSQLAQMDNVTQNQIPEPIRLVAYRVVEEALSNVLKHARATMVDVSLKLLAGERLQVTVCDNGRGFHQDSMKMGLGLSSIEGRVEQVGGSWNISSRVGYGTTLTVLLPLNSKQPEILRSRSERQEIL